MSIVLGLNAKLLRGTAGTTAATEVKNVQDLSVSLESGDADITTRASAGWRASVATLKDASIEFGMIYDTTDTDFTAFSDAYFNNTAIALFASDGDGSGLDCDVVVTGFSIEQPLEDAMKVSVTCKPTITGGASSRAPQWKKKAA